MNTSTNIGEGSSLVEGLAVDFAVDVISITVVVCSAVVVGSAVVVVGCIVVVVGPSIAYLGQKQTVQLHS